MSVTKASLFLVHDETGQRYPIKGQVLIGSRHGDIVYPEDKALSPKHCRLRLTPGGLTVEDLDSTLGTRVNGHRIRPKRPHMLLPGDRITVGEQTLKFDSVSLARRVRPPKQKRKRRDRQPPQKGQGPEQLAGHFLILAILGTFVWQLAQHQPLLGVLPEQIVSLGANSNPFTTNGEWWRLITAMFLHYGALQVVGDVLALFVFAEAVAVANSGRALLLIFFFSGFAAGAAALAFNPATAVMAGTTGAIAGLAGAWFALRQIGHARLIELRAIAPLAALALILNSIGFDESPFDPVSLCAGVAAGFIAQLALDYFEARREILQELLVGALLTSICFALTTVVPHKKISFIDGSSKKIESPYERVESEMTAAFDNYENLGRMVRDQTVAEPRMAEIIRVELIPSFVRVKAKLGVLKAQSEGERRQLELDRRLVGALLEQVTAMAKFSASKDPKDNADVEKWTVDVDKLSVEWKRLKAAPPREPATR